MSMPGKTLAVLLGVFMVISFMACNTGVEHDNNESVAEKNTVTNKSTLQRAELITENNRDLVGTVTVSSETPEVFHSEEEEHYDVKEEEQDQIPQNDIIKELDEDVPLPSTITVFSAANGITPEIIFPNGSCAVFVPSDNKKGWTCEKGGRIQFNFEKYPSAVVEKQAMVVGVVLNGKMLSGEIMRDLSGTYVFETDESGDYAIYVLSGTSDYLALKKGRVYTD